MNDFHVGKQVVGIDAAFKHISSDQLIRKGQIYAIRSVGPPDLDPQDKSGQTASAVWPVCLNPYNDDLLDLPSSYPDQVLGLRFSGS